MPVVNVTTPDNNKIRVEATDAKQLGSVSVSPPVIGAQNDNVYQSNPLGPGTYRVTVTVNGRKYAYTVTIPMNGSPKKVSVTAPLVDNPTAGVVHVRVDNASFDSLTIQPSAGLGTTIDPDGAESVNTSPLTAGTYALTVTSGTTTYPYSVQITTEGLVKASHA